MINLILLAMVFFILPFNLFALCYIKGKIGKISIILCACVCINVKGFFQITATTSNPCKLYCSLVLGCWHGILTEEKFECDQAFGEL